MRAVLQRVTSSSVHVSGRLVGKIDRGLCALIGITTDDNQTDIDYIVNKMLSLKLWDSNDKPWANSVVDNEFEILCVSQFTLFARTSKGTKPDFHRSMKGGDSKEVFENLVGKLKLDYRDKKIQVGEFGAMMDVSIQNDGPVTIIIDSKDRKS